MRLLYLLPVTEKPVREAETREKAPRMWTVRAEDGATFGPATLASLQAWARDGRLAPSHMVSCDGTSWQPVARIAPLAMDWVAEISPGTFYGPVHAQALEDLVRDGSLAPDVPRFSRSEAPSDAPSGAADAGCGPKALERRMETLRAAFTRRTEELDQQILALAAEREQLKGELGTRDAEFDAERQAFKAAESRLQADLAKARAAASGLEQQLGQAQRRDGERAAASARIAELEARLAEADERLKVEAAAHQTALQQARQALHDVEKNLLAERAAQARRQQEAQTAAETLKALRLREESLRKLLQQAGALLGSEAPRHETLIEEGVVTDAAPPPRNDIASLGRIEAQAQREISRLGQKANLFGKRK